MSSAVETSARNDWCWKADPSTALGMTWRMGRFLDCACGSARNDSERNSPLDHTHSYRMTRRDKKEGDSEIRFRVTLAFHWKKEKLLSGPLCPVVIGVNRAATTVLAYEFVRECSAEVSSVAFYGSKVCRTVSVRFIACEQTGNQSVGKR